MRDLIWCLSRTEGDRGGTPPLGVEKREPAFQDGGGPGVGAEVAGRRETRGRKDEGEITEHGKQNQGAGRPGMCQPR